VYSCNVTVPPDLSRLARGLASDCFEATPRDRHSLLVKRLGDGRPSTLARRVREALSGTEPFEARISRIELFRDPPVGRGPVAYLRVDSEPLLEIHRKLCAVSDPVEGLEGDEYDPHVTIARGGDAGRLAGRTVDRRTWRIESLSLWSAEYNEVIERISLPV
jgi:2'-5' RNA ligase